MNRFLLGVLATLVVLFLGVYFYLILGFSEVRADIPPSRFETYLMRKAVHASAKKEAPTLSNPIQPTDENLIAGAKLYLNACAGCHGTPGKPFGDKPPILFPRIPELPVVGTELSEAQILSPSTASANPACSANGTWASDEKLWTVAAYIKRMNSLPPAVQAVVAKLTSGQQ